MHNSFGDQLTALLDRMFGVDRTQRYHDRFVFRAESRVVTQQDGHALLKVYDAEEAQAVTLRVYDLLGVEGDSHELATTMWQSELRILTRLLPEEWRRPGLVRFVDGNEDRPSDTMYVAWEDGHKATLAESLRDPRMVGAQLHEVPTKVDLMIMLCEALFELHSQGVIHREITPHTICLWDQPPLRAAITGFGMSIFMNNYLWAPAPDSFSTESASSGQLAYVAPERFAFLTNSTLDVNGLMVQPGEDYRQDIYSLGICLAEWFTRPLPTDHTLSFLPVEGGYDEYAHLEWIQDQVHNRVNREPLSNNIAAQTDLKNLLLDVSRPAG
jgi:serine/threonine protein kinase